MAQHDLVLHGLSLAASLLRCLPAGVIRYKIGKLPAAPLLQKKGAAGISPTTYQRCMPRKTFNSNIFEEELEMVWGCAVVYAKSNLM